MSTTPQSGRYAIESFAKRLLCRIVRELEKIPEPMQLILLDFIRFLGSSYRVVATTQNETKLNDKKHYPLRGMSIQSEPNFDAPMTDLWTALGE